MSISISITYLEVADTEDEEGSLAREVAESGLMW